jgi:hypothetical protein
MQRNRGVIVRDGSSKDAVCHSDTIPHNRSCYLYLLLMAYFVRRPSDMRYIHK